MRYWILVILEKKRLFLYKDNKVFKSYPIAIGKKTTPTPKGSYFIKNKAENQGEIYGPIWMGLSIQTGGYGIHGTNHPESIGHAVSDGCIRMYNHDIIELSRYVKVKTKVVII